MSDIVHNELIKNIYICRKVDILPVKSGKFYHKQITQASISITESGHLVHESQVYTKILNTIVQVIRLEHLFLNSL